MAGKLAQRIRSKAPNRLMLNASELRLLQNAGLFKGREGFVDREVKGKIIRHFGVLRRIEESRMITNPRGERVIDTQIHTVFDVQREEDTGFIAEPRSKRTKNHVWSA